MKLLALLLTFLVGTPSCHPSRLEAAEEVRSMVQPNMNLALYADSVVLELLPVKDTYIQLYKGAQVVVAELAVHPEDSLDVVWVKVAHNQEVQGWIRESELIDAFVPVDSISQFIHLFSHTQVPYFIAVLSLFVGGHLLRMSRKKQLRMVYLNDIDSIYPLLLCLLIALSATLYESIQLFAPDVWQRYFFAPTLSPFKVPAILSVLLIVLWLKLLVALAALDDMFSQLSPSEAFFYLLGLLSVGIFCYLFFMFTTRFYVGYAFLGVAVVLFFRKAHRLPIYKYRCGGCGKKLQAKGTCPYCGAVNR